MTCKFKSSQGVCKIISDLAGTPCTPSSSACEACTGDVTPQAVNRVTVGSAIAARRQAGVDHYDLTRHLRKTVFPSVSQRIVPSWIPQVGDELKKRFNKWVGETGDCGCAADVAWVNRLGVAGSTDKFDEIVDKVANKTSKWARPLLRPGIRRYLRQSIKACRMSVVWVYWAGGAEGEELRYSIRSAVKNITDAKNFAVCGDVPDWFTGVPIHSPRFNAVDAAREYGSRRFAKWCDSVVKLKRICDCDDITENFLWMYDDTFIMKPWSIQEIAVPRAGGVLHSGDLDNRVNKKWREVMRRTAQDLTERQRPQRNYSTHYPVVYNKTLLRQTLEEFSVPQSPRVIESLYMNHHSEIEAMPASAVFQYRKRVPEGWAPHDHVKIINVGGWNTHVQRIIEPMFDRCELEADECT